jgi:hypothetical protein
MMRIMTDYNNIEKCNALALLLLLSFIPTDNTDIY